MLICQQMWSDNDGPFEGKHYRLAETINVPQPPRGRMPILIGGGGERKTLRLTAQYADVWNVPVRPEEGASVADFVRGKLVVLREHCDRLGTDFDAIEKTVLYVGDVLGHREAFYAEMERYAQLGISLVSLAPPRYRDPVEWTTTVVAEILPRLQNL